MGYLFLPFLALLIITGKEIFLFGVLISLGFMVLGPALGATGKIIADGWENDFIKKGIAWTLFAIGGVCVYAAMFL